MPPAPSADVRTRPAAGRFEVDVVDPLTGAAARSMEAPLDAEAGARPERGGGGADRAPAHAAAFAAHPDWVRAIARHLAPPGLRVARVHERGVEVLRLPHPPAARGRSLRHPAHDHLTLGDLDAAPTASAATLTDAVDAALRDAASRVGLVPAWRAHAVPEHSALVRAVRARTGIAAGPIDAAGWTLRPARETARFELSDGASPVPGKLRRNLRRLRARLEATGAGEASLRLHGVDDPAALDAAFERFVALEAAGWKSAGAASGGTAIADDAATLGFYRELTRCRSAGLAPVIAELESGGRTVAAKLGLRTGSALHLLKIAYDESLGAFAPGSLLLESLLEAAPGEGLERVSLVSAPAWAARWHPVVAPAWHVVRYADTAAGRLAAGVDRTRGAALERYRRARTQRSSH